MNITKISSGSWGNCIVINDGVSSIMLDAGVQYQQMSRAVNISDLSAALITHEHLDHCRAVDQLARRGVQMFASGGTWSALWERGIKVSHTQEGCRTGVTYTVGSFDVRPFDVMHDCREPLGFFLRSNETGDRIVYIVDSGLVTYNFKGVTHWLIEANHYQQGIESLDRPEKVKARIRRNHMSFENVKKLLSDSDLSSAKEIHLLHLSNEASNRDEFVKQIQRMTGVPVYT